jgi:hypothetical protein
MDFSEAADELLDCTSERELAAASGISVTRMRKARIEGSAVARSLPHG